MVEDNKEFQLYLVATPIGNLEDISNRARKILETVDVIACEDTRKSGKLLELLNIKKRNPLLSFFDHNEDQALMRIKSLILSGNKVALISSAGTPGISDPGYKLVQLAIQNHFTITMVPGPTALIMGLVLSGLPSHSFTFRGFPPRKVNQRKKFLLVDVSSPHTLIFYESPHRLLKFLEDCYSIYGDRKMAVLNDLTKYFETIIRGTTKEVISQLQSSKIQGEYVILIEGKG